MGAQVIVKKAIFFDIYGTLVDISTDEYDPSAYSVLSRYLGYHGVQVSPDALKEAYLSHVGRTLKESNEVYPEVDLYKVFYSIMHKHGSKRYSKSMVVDTAMLFRALTRKIFGAFPMICDVLIDLSKDYKLAIISDAQWVFTPAELATLDLARFFKTKILSSQFGYKKPDVRLFELAMNKLRVTPEECVYIGDNPKKDLVGAKKAGIDFLFFRTECRSYDGFQPDGCFNHYSQLPRLLRDLDRRDSPRL